MADQPVIRALSIRQPWAWAITRGLKSVENRTWWTSYQGPLAIHAGQKEETRDLEFVLRTASLLTGHTLADLAQDYRDRRWLGCYVGYASIIDVTTSLDSPWFFGPYGFVFGRDARSFRSSPQPGRLGIYTVPEPAAGEIRRLLSEALR